MKEWTSFTMRRWRRVLDSNQTKPEPRGARTCEERVPQGHSRALPAGPSSNNSREFVMGTSTRLRAAASGSIQRAPRGPWGSWGPWGRADPLGQRSVCKVSAESRRERASRPFAPSPKNHPGRTRHRRPTHARIKLGDIQVVTDSAPKNPTSCRQTSPRPAGGRQETRRSFPSRWSG